MVGTKKVRRIGNSFEFEKIKEYVQGDDVRDINWKATAKRSALMINQYQEERSQQVFCMIDKGRVMKMPFNELSLLDYAINASVVISNMVLQKMDRVGLISFSRKIDEFVQADKRNVQMRLIQDTLFNLSTDYAESDYGRLYAQIKSQVKQRSLLLLFTNFEVLTLCVGS